MKVTITPGFLQTTLLPIYSPKHYYSLLALKSISIWTPELTWCDFSIYSWQAGWKMVIQRISESSERWFFNKVTQTRKNFILCSYFDFCTVLQTIQDKKFCHVWWWRPSTYRNSFFVRLFPLNWAVNIKRHKLRRRLWALWWLPFVFKAPPPHAILK